MRLDPGATFAGRFIVRAHAGKGGMGSVYRASDLDTKQTVALKVLTLEGEHDVARFAREASLLATIHHPNIVNYVAHGEADRVHYLAQEWVDGVTLGTQERTVGLTARDAVTIAIGIADALGAAHALGVIHRDIKPSNIILVGGEPSRVKLVDFGIARKANQAGVLTRTGVMIGTPSYMSPEQALGETLLDPTADVWSLGCVLYELLAGRVAFAGTSSTAIRAKVLLGGPAPLQPLCPEASRELRRLIVDMLAKGRSERPQSGDVVAARLRELPPTGDGPRRVLTSAEKTTNAMPVRPKRGPDDKSLAASQNCFVFVTASDDPQPVAAGSDHGIARIAENRQLDVHVFDDGSVLLASKRPGKAGALDAANAALDLRGEVFDGAMSVFARNNDEVLDDAIDRGSTLLEQATMEAIFQDVGSNIEPVIRIDDVIAELLHDEIAIERDERGPVLTAKSR